MRGRQLAERVWAWLKADRRVEEALSAWVVLFLLTLAVPQFPASVGDALAFSRWLAEMRPALGRSSRLLASLGLFSLRSSLWMRALMAFLAAVVVVRWVALAEAWAALPSHRRRVYVLTGLGGLCLLLGWELYARLGWVVPDIVAWPDQPLTVPGYPALELPSGNRSLLWSGHYGLFLLPHGDVVGLEVWATDMQGETLLLATRAGDRERLRFAFSPAQMEVFFALPEVGYGFRVNYAEGQVRLQAYRLATGDFLAEITVTREDALIMEGAVLHLGRRTVHRWAAVYNPGAPWTVGGVLLLALGVTEARLRGRMGVGARAEEAV